MDNRVTIFPVTPEQRTSIITGASKGIGRSTAEILAARGERVIGAARSRKPDGFPGAYYEVDFTDDGAVRQFIAEIDGKEAITGIVNNVGLVKPAALEEISIDDYDTVMRVNVHSMILLTQAFVGGMKERGWGRIVNTSSLTVLGVPYRSSYAAAKSAMVSLTKSWGIELAPFGITVNSVAPGPTETELFLTNNPPGSESHGRYVKMVPMNRVAAPKEIGEVIAFLMGDGASFMTGQTLYVDGGASIGKVMV